MNKKLRSMRNWAFGGATMICATLPIAAMAQNVVLRSVDDSVSIAGELLGFEDGFFLIKTTLGEMKISATRMVCEGDACPVEEVTGDVIIAGSEDVGVGLMPLLLTGYAETLNGAVEEKPGENDKQKVLNLIGDGGFGDPLGNFVINSSSSNDAFIALLDRGTQIGMSTRRIRPAEARSLRDAGAGNMIDLEQERVVAVDSIAVIVHQSNPLSGLSLADLDRIYSGLATNWSEFGGNNAPIVAYSREEGSGSNAVFEESIFSQSGRSRSGFVRDVASNDEMAAVVNRDPNAIGFVGSAFVRGAKTLDIIGSCGLEVSPDIFSAKTEEYPIQRRLYLYNRADNLSDNVRNFLNYSILEGADGVVAKSGFVDLGVARIAQSDPEGRMRDLVEATVDPAEFGLMRDLLVDMFRWDRLSTTFRFASGSSRLDGKGLLDLDRLINFLKQQPSGTEITLVGFTDGDGAFEANQALSLGRAEQVMVAISDKVGESVANVTLSAKGFGELSPSACNDTLEGKRINRRVEVWIRNPA